jgi:hypothetical protein
MEVKKQKENLQKKMKSGVLCNIFLDIEKLNVPEQIFGSQGEVPLLASARQRSTEGTPCGPVQVRYSIMVTLVAARRTEVERMPLLTLPERSPSAVPVENETNTPPKKTEADDDDKVDGSWRQIPEFESRKQKFHKKHH